MTLPQYLQKVLGYQKYCELRLALAHNQKVIVKGEQKTGKTTLVNLLNVAGYHAVEDFDIFEITLEKPIDRMIPDFEKTISTEQGIFGKC